ncbi:MAG: hypothetical protein VR73_08235 [Gammaproteobacteria bacterium BRH_c0]|nr:MAG: hypothetical protein VR73_08235 [Gammaproteobacteria bacterium BRH_c0]
MKTSTIQQFRKLTLVSALALTTGWASLSQAGTDTENLSVSATVADNCTIATSALAFGSYDPIVTHSATALENTGSVSVTCTSGAAVAITLGQGANADTGSSDAAPARRLTDGGGNFLSYSLYSDSGRATAWTNDTDGDVEDTGTGTEETHTVYGSVASGQNVPAGSYSDTVVATVTY